MSEPVTTVQQVTIAAPGSQVIALLLAGLLLAFSFQIIVANIQVIVGLVALGIRYVRNLDSVDNSIPATYGLSEPPLPIYTDDSAIEPSADLADLQRNTQGNQSEELLLVAGSTLEAPPPESYLVNGNDEKTGAESTENGEDTAPDLAKTIEWVAGIGLMSSIILAIAPASFLAVKLSRVDGPWLGGISGLVLWSAYFLMLTWFSSRTLSSVVQTVFGGAFGSLRQLLRAIGRLFQQQSGLSEKRVKKEIQRALSNYDVDSRVQSYLSELPPVQLDLKPVQEMLLSMLALPALQSVAGQQLLETIDRQDLRTLLRQQNQFSDTEIEQFLDQLEPIWASARSQLPKSSMATELIQLLKTTQAVPSPPVNRDLEADTPSRSPLQVDKSTLIGMLEGTDASALLYALLEKVDANSLLNELLRRADLSDWDVARLWQQYQMFRQRLTGQSADPLTVLPQDVEYYLLSAPPWELKSTVLAEDIPALFVDPEANPLEVQRQLHLLDETKFTQILNQRGDLDSEQVAALTEQLEALRQGALEQVRVALEAERLAQLGQAFKAEVEALQPESITAETLSIVLETLLEPMLPDTVLALAVQTDEPMLTQWLQANTQLAADQLPMAAQTLNAGIQAQANQIQARQAAIQAAIAEGKAKLTAYLTHTPLDQLTEAGIRQKLQTLVEELAVEPIDIYQELPQLETAVLNEILAQRQELDPSQRDRLVTWLQTGWREQVPAVSVAEQTAQTLIQRIETALKAIARSQQLDQLTLDDLKPTLLSLLRDPNLALNLLAQDLIRIDWSPLLALLREIRFDGQQIREFLQWLQAQLYAAARLPRRWLTRLQDQEPRFEQRIRRYLKHHQKGDLQPEKMRRDLQRILQIEMKRTEAMGAVDQLIAGLGKPPQLASPKLPDLPEPEVIAEILSEREDLKPTEVTQISQSMSNIWQEVATQFAAAQQEAQTALRSLLNQLSTSFKALQISPATLEKLEQDLDELLAPLNTSVNQLSDSLNLWLPDSPLANLRDRIQAWNQTNLDQLIQSRDEASNAVNRYLQKRLNAVRQELNQELSSLEKQALKQLNDIRKAATTATIWLLMITLASAGSSAIAGVLAVQF